MTAFRVSEAAAAELDLVADLYGQSFDEPYPRPALNVLLASPGALALICRIDLTDEVRPVGFAVVRAVAGEGEILSLGVAARYQRRGAGGAVLRASLERLGASGAAAAFLEVGADNTAAIALYRKAGFESVGRRKGYYLRRDRRRVDALIMRTTVKNTYSSWK